MRIHTTRTQRSSLIWTLRGLGTVTMPADPAWAVNLWRHTAETLWDPVTQTSTAGLNASHMESIRTLPLDSCVGDSITDAYEAAWILHQRHSEALPDGDADGVTLALFLSAFEQGTVSLFG
jgi:hypothetical protein